LGGIVPNWLHEFVGGTLAEIPEALPFNIVPLLTSLVVALGGLLLGWLVYRNVKSPAEDKLQINVLKNKYYFDEIYNFLFVKPAYWFAETFAYKFLDQIIIDGFLNRIGGVAQGIGRGSRKYCDAPVVNGFGDLIGESTKKIGKSLAPIIQKGRIQYYMVASLAVAILVAVLYYFWLA
jgi:NADH:ubiquinone oxidoreductase subunit 5 (subunit L)/multisubunit Na+/H+ antiporter MnhA subunit